MKLRWDLEISEKLLTRGGKSLVLGLVSLMVFGGAFGTPVLDNGVLTYTVADSETEANTFASYGTVNQVVKLGAGELIVSADNSAYAGTIEVQAGVLNCAHGYAFGSKNATVYVRDGAQVKTSFSTTQGDSFIPSPVHITGSGPDGSGAIFSKNSGMGDKCFAGGVVLDGPAKVGGTARIGFSFTMNGHALTNAVSTEHIMRGISTTSPDHIVYSGGSRFVMSGAFNGSAANTLTIAKSDGKVCYWNSGVTSPWTLLINENGHIASGAGSSKTVNRWTGPVVIAAGKTLTFSNYNNSPAAELSVGATGSISGDGRVISGNYAGLNVYLSGVNTYTGGTTLSSGTLWALVNKSIPETGTITLTSGTLNFMVDSGCWEMSEVSKRIANLSGTGGTACFYTSSGKSATDDVGFTSPAAGIRIGHAGAGSLVTTGPIAGTPRLTNIGGSWTIRSATVGDASLEVQSGTLTLDGAGTLWTSNYYSYVGNKAAADGTLVIRNTTVDGKLTTGGSNRGANLYVGHVSNARGLVKVEGTGALTNWIELGVASKSVGAVHQTGGAVRTSCNSTADGIWAASGYGFYDAAGGTVTLNHCLNIGKDPAGVGILRVSGGTANVAADLFIGSGGTGVVHVTGGRITGSDIRLGQLQWATSGAFGTSIFTIDGEGAVVDLNTLSLGQRLNPAISMININRGVVGVETPIQRIPTGQNTTFYTESSQKDGFVNFNGGTLRPNKTATSLFAAGELTRPTKVTVFAGGATIDANGREVSVTVPLEAPTGWGVASIALPSSFTSTGWFGPQHVTIMGGSGRGAAAITDFDASVGTISRIDVTSPGQGYAEGDTLTVAIPDSRNSSTLACTATLAPLASGGLTVTNGSASAGTVTLNAVNTYTGATVVAAGTLKVGVANAIAASRAARVAPGATLNLNNLGDLSVDSLGGGGTVANGNVTAAGLVFPAATATNSTLTLTGSLTLGANASLTITNVDEATFPKKGFTLLTANGGITGEIATVKGFEATEHPNLWKAYRVGNSIRLHYAHGTAILIR